eukprot:10961901-Heterocapsa_arctica.AAC.1
MELAVWIEERVKTPGNTRIPANSREEEKPVSMKMFQQAINMLKEMMEVQKMEITQQAKRSRGVMRE